MLAITNRWNSQKAQFKDMDALGLFVNNHDNPRFLSKNPDWRLFKSAIAFGLTARGIPFFYYGDEQGFNGGPDPNNREPMWGHFDRNHELFKFVQTIQLAKKAASSQTQPFQERYVDDNFYCYTRGKFFVGLTNRVGSSMSLNVPNVGYPENTVLCNIFNSADCVTIHGNTLPLVLNNGEVKIYVSKSSSFFKTAHTAGQHLKSLFVPESN